MPLDPVDSAVIGQSLIAAAREMGAKLIRSAYSTIVREAQDASAALLDRDGNVVAQAELIPMQLGPMKMTFTPCAATCPSYSIPAGVVPKTKPFCWSSKVSKTMRTASASVIS